MRPSERPALQPFHSSPVNVADKHPADVVGLGQVAERVREAALDAAEVPNGFKGLQPAINDGSTVGSGTPAMSRGRQAARSSASRAYR